MRPTPRGTLPVKEERSVQARCKAHRAKRSGAPSHHCRTDRAAEGKLSGPCRVYFTGPDSL
jgi:hypothetical protein